MLDIAITYGLPVLAAVVGFIAGRTKNKGDDLVAAVLADPEVREILEALRDRVEELEAADDDTPTA